MPFVQTYNPSVGFAASSPYTGEPIEVRTNLIQYHRPMPPLCKGRGTAHGGGGIVKCGTDQCLPCVRGGGPPVAVEGLPMAVYAT